MKVSIHFITSLLLVIVLWPFIGPYSLWAIVGGYLIDVDHYLYTIFRLKTFSIKRSYQYHATKEHHQKNKPGQILHLFHTIEFWIFMILMSIIAYKKNWNFIFYMFSITFLGMILHLSLDITHGIRNKIIKRRAISFMAWFIKFGKSRKAY